MVSEPNKSALRKSRWYRYVEENACIIRRNSALKISAWGKGYGFVWVKTREVYIYSVYISPNCTTGKYEEFLQALQTSIVQHGRKVVVGGDFNAKSHLWGAPLEDRRGGMLVDWLNSNDLVVANTGDSPTFVRGRSESHIDITITSDGEARLIRGWKVLDDMSLSLHRYIVFELCWEGEGQEEICWSRGELMKGSFTEAIRQNRILSEEGIELEVFMNELCRVHKNETMRRRKDAHENNIYWWTEETETQRRETLVARRRYMKSRGRTTEDVCRERDTRNNVKSSGKQ